MIDTLYIEQAVADHPRVRALCARFPKARRISCERYGEVFNRKAQHFALQKRRPALILAHKHDRTVLPAPAGYGVGGSHNYYFSHMLNCVYDCRYCFLQGMYRSAHYVLFVNYEDFAAGIENRLQEHGDQPVWFFSGYDCDSLALDPVTGFAAFCYEHFPTWGNAWLELRTKSTQVRGLLDRPPRDNWVVAFSFSPHAVAQALEHKTPGVERRLEAAAKLQRHGWKIGLRFDPLIYHEGYQAAYRDLFATVFSRLDVNALHSVSLGPFRVPEGYFANMVRLYPRERLFAGPLAREGGMVSYRTDLEQEMNEYCTTELLRHVSNSVFFPCTQG